MEWSHADDTKLKLLNSIKVEKLRMLLKSFIQILDERYLGRQLV